MSEQAVYVYGVAAADEAPSLPLDGGGLDPRFPPQLVGEGDLVALVSDIEQAELERRVAAARAGNLPSLEPLLRAHERVLSIAQETGTVLPFRFGVSVRSREAVLDLLEQRGADLAARIEFLRGVREWGVKAMLDREPFEAFVVAATPELAATAAPGDGPGRAFLARKRLDRELEQALREGAALIAAATHERIAACARSAVANPPQPRELSGHPHEMILNGAYLVERRHEDDLRAVVEQLAGEFAGRGVELELTGPWPPFNFVETPIGSPLSR